LPDRADERLERRELGRVGYSAYEGHGNWVRHMEEKYYRQGTQKDQAEAPTSAWHFEYP